MIRKLQISPIVVIFLAITSIAFSEPDISILWEKDIAQVGRAIKPYTIKVVEDKSIVRVIAVSYIRQTKESPKNKAPKLIEYRFNYKDDTAELKTLLSMDEGDITITLPQGGIKNSRLIDNTIVMIRNQYKSFNFQELTIGSDWQVKTREIPGLTRGSVSTHGACRNKNGDVFLCGNSGYIRKVKGDGIVAWDTNYKSDKGEDGIFGVAFSETEQMLVAFGFSFEPDTQFTTKDSSLWLANLDSEGNIKAKTEFEGIVNFGKRPSYCLSKSDNPIVIYDNNAEVKNCKIYVSKFSKDLNTKTWTTLLFEKKDTMLLSTILTPFEDGRTLSSFISMTGRIINLHFYILDKNGSVVNQSILENIMFAEYTVAVLKDRIFLVTDERRYDENKDEITDFAKLTCFKISPCEME